MQSRLGRLIPDLRGVPAVTTISVICAVVFVANIVASRIQVAEGLSLGALLPRAFGIYFPFIAKGAFWQPVTYIFLHGSFPHIFLNLFTLIFFGASVERLIGTRRFWVLFFLTGIIGGLGWMVCDYFEPQFWMWVQTLPHDFCRHLAQRWGESQVAGVQFNVCIGASASVCGLIGAFAALFPDARLTVLLLYVIPIRMKARTFAILLAIFSLVSAVLSTGHIAHAAHLIGAVAGYLFEKWENSRGPYNGQPRFQY